MRRGFWLGVALLALLGGGMTALRYFRPAPPPAALAQPRDVWAARFKDMQGQWQPLAQYRGKPLVINVWASWCGPCREEIPDFVAAQTAFGERVQIVGLAIDHPSAIAKFIQEVPVNYPLLYGEQDALDWQKAAGNRSGALPFTLVFDAAGKQVFSKAGRVSRAQLDGVLTGLIH